MPDRSELEALFTDNLVWVGRIAASLCRRNGMNPEQADEFLAWAQMRLIENDYAILAKFRGESALTTYLTVVMTTLFRDYRVSLWGRWRPSAAARRRGDVAIRLEILYYRDRYRLDQAGEILRDAGYDLSPAELRELLAELPPHATPRPVEMGDESLMAMPGTSRADDLLEAEESADERRMVQETLAAGLESLSQEDRTIVRLWMEGTSVADIARALSLPQKPLYRRLERIFGELRKPLVAAGVTAEQVHRMLDEDRAIEPGEMGHSTGVPIQ